MSCGGHSSALRQGGIASCGPKPPSNVAGPIQSRSGRVSAERRTFASVPTGPKLRKPAAHGPTGRGRASASETRRKSTMLTERKVAVITGASQGIGAALVKAYRDRNYRVVATARTMSPSNDDDVLAVPGDIADRNTAERAIFEGLARFGRIDTLVNNAGIFIGKRFTQYTEADYAAMIGVNVTGFFHITQLAIEQMEKHGSGHVVQVSTQPRRSRACRGTVRPGVADEGQPECSDEIARDRVREPGNSSECDSAGRHQVANASGGDTCATRWSASAGSYGRDIRRRRCDPLP